MPDDREQRTDDGTKVPGGNAERVRPNDDSEAERERVEQLEGNTRPPQGGASTRDPG